MPKSTGQKTKLLHIIKILQEQTDEQHPLSTADIIAQLEALGIHSERKSIYSDMECLTDFGFDIIHNHSRQGGGYYLASRDFELPELKLLVDAVQSSRFITTKKSRDLIAKLEAFAGKHDAGKLQRQVYVVGRVKTENESIYYNIDTIHKAIQENQKISFAYLEWNIHKELTPREQSKRIVSPWALIWRDENYYLAAYDSNAKLMKHYRVDKMGEVTILKKPRDGAEEFKHLDLAEYANKTFGMFGGKEEQVTMQFPKSLIGVVIDRFGKDVYLRPEGEDLIFVKMSVAVSGQFFGWLCGLGKGIQIVSPEYVREEYIRWIADIIENT